MVSAAQPVRTRPIVVVDDDPLLREFVCMALDDEGYRTVTAADGMQALEVLTREQPALVLMDVGMPLLGGRDLAARVQEVCGADVPCILMSGGAVEGGGAHDDIPVAAYLRKPFGLDELLDLVRRHAVDAEPRPLN